MGAAVMASMSLVLCDDASGASSDPGPGTVPGTRALVSSGVVRGDGRMARRRSAPPNEVSREKLRGWALQSIRTPGRRQYWPSSDNNRCGLN
jgi:hypothetical protein